MGSRAAMPTLLLVTNHFHNESEVQQFCLHVASRRTPVNWDVSIAISDNSDSMQCEPVWARATLFRPQRNLGYFGGCAFALEAWKRRFRRTPDMIGVVNTDLTFADDLFEVLLSSSFASPVGVVAPDIRLPDGTAQNPFAVERPSARKVAMMRAVFGSRWLTRGWMTLHGAKRKIKRMLGAPDERPDEARTIYAPHGAAVFLLRPFFENDGALDFGAFMYGEEFYVAEQARRLGLSVWYEPRCRIVHDAHTVIGAMPSEQTRQWKSDSFEYLWTTYFSPLAAANEAPTDRRSAAARQRGRGIAA